MVHLQAVNTIHAPIARCFELSLNIDLEIVAAADFSLRAIGGVTHGTIGLGERVTWKAKQFGIWIRHTTEITACESPSYFQDSMVSGVFQHFTHDHTFVELGAAHTQMRDDIRLAMPLWLTGPVAEQLFVKRRMIRLLEKRNAVIKEQAEAQP